MLMTLSYAIGPFIFGKDTVENLKGRHNNYHDRADLLCSLVVFPILIYYAVVNIFFDPDMNTETGRILKVNDAGLSFAYLYMARQTTSLWFMFVGSNLKPRDIIMMVVHHVVSTVAYAFAVYYERLQYYGTLDGLCEVTTIFLTLMLVFKTLGLDNPKPWYVKLNGISLWASFFVFRLLLFPYWLYAFYTDCFASTESVCYKETNLHEKIMYPCITLLLLVMSTMWFIPITKGMMKALGLMSDKKAVAKKAN